jgi:hypothetical protein
VGALKGDIAFISLFFIFGVDLSAYLDFFMLIASKNVQISGM